MALKKERSVAVTATPEPNGIDVLEQIKHSSCVTEYQTVKAVLSLYDLVEESKQDRWITSPNSFFDGASPADLILAGQGGYVRNMLESYADGTYF